MSSIDSYNILFVVQMVINVSMFILVLSYWPSQGKKKQKKTGR